MVCGHIGVKKLVGKHLNGQFNSCPPTKLPPVSLFCHDVTLKPSVTHWCNVTLNFSVQVPGREESNTKLNIWSSFFFLVFISLRLGYYDIKNDF